MRHTSVTVLLVLAGCPAPTVAPLECTVTEHDFASIRFDDVHATPGGTVYAAGPRGLSVRTPDGTWGVDLAAPPGISRVAGHGEDVWIASDAGVFRLDGGAWVDTAAPVGGTLVVRGPSDVRLVFVFPPPPDVAGPLPIHVRQWDGAAWSPSETHVIGGHARAFDSLPDGRLVALASNALWVEGEAGWEGLPTGFGTPWGVSAAPDGTLLAFGDGVALGDASGLAPSDPGVSGVEVWVDGLARGADDLWLLGRSSAFDGSRPSIVAHWDGAGWSVVPHDATVALSAIAALDDGVVVVGGIAGRAAALGDASGLSAEIDTAAPDRLELLAVDDVTGEALGASPFVSATASGDDWQTHPLRELDGYLSEVAVSDGRIAAGLLRGQLVVADESGTRRSEAPDGMSVNHLCGASGTLFALGSVPSQEPRGLVERGAGWEPLDLSGLPRGAFAASCWADTPERLWIGLATEQGGAVALWDGEGTSVVASLPVVPGWMARQSDGRLWMLGAEPGQVPGGCSFDGRFATFEPQIPRGTRALHIAGDGTRFAAVFDPDSDEPPTIRSREPGATAWSVVATSIGPLRTLAGHGDDVWALLDSGDRAWSRTCR
ncbi:MAG: hypothetical protein H6737_29625 [Alphaproteobacteria bacterium]|nr:hypothetical protein [Alphaproteobacteria bacterium]